MIRSTFKLLAVAVLGFGGLAAGAMPSAQADDPPPGCAIPGMVIMGGAGNDVLTGTPYNDVIYGNGGNDTINGMGGQDTIYGGDGNDVLLGGDCDDMIYGEDGHDKIDGQAGEGDYGDGGPLTDRCSAATETQVSC